MESIKLEAIRVGASEIYNLYQYSISDHHKSCLSINTTSSDSTGTRLYAGGHVAIRFIRHLLKNSSFKHIFDNDTQNVIELGCGIGVVSLLSFLPTHKDNFLRDRINKIVLTDGFSPVTKIAELNYSILNLEHNEIINDKIKVLTQELQWGDKTVASKLLNEVNGGECFEIVVGTDLMYYNVNVTQLLDTVLALIKPNGIMIHAHLFRVDGNKSKIIDYFTEIEWDTLEISIEEFVATEELVNHPEWYKINVLLSANKNKIDLIQTRHPTWCKFSRFDDDNDDDNVNYVNFKFPEL